MLDITFRQLQVFVEAVDAGSFRACAERLGITQVSVSGHIRSMERILGHGLFERRRGAKSGLTEEGARTYRHAVALLDQIENFADDLGSSSAAAPRRRLIVALPDYVSFRLEPILAEFGLAHPEWQVELEPSDQESALDMIERGKADLGFVLALEGGSPAGSAVVQRERIGLYVSVNHPLAHHGSITAEALSNYPFIFLPKKNPLRAVVDEFLLHLNIRGNPVALQTENGRLARRTLLQGKALACLFTHTIRADIEAGNLVEIPLAADAPAIEISLVASQGAFVRRARSALLDVLNGRRVSGRPHS